MTRVEGLLKRKVLRACWIEGNNCSSIDVFQIENSTGITQVNTILKEFKDKKVVIEIKNLNGD
jgi:hypothetical protein